MDCREALEIIKEWGEATIRGKEAKGSSGDAEEAFNHIRECEKKDCRRLWRRFNSTLVLEFDDKEIKLKAFD